jgi:hypothetical protein
MEQCCRDTNGHWLLAGPFEYAVLRIRMRRQFWLDDEDLSSGTPERAPVTSENEVPLLPINP